VKRENGRAEGGMEIGEGEGEREGREGETQDEILFFFVK
jgi:hypothetical protein